MARANVLLLIAGSLMLAAVCVQAKEFTFGITEYAPESNDILSFSPKNSGNDETGNGYIYENVASQTPARDSPFVGFVAGLSFRINQNTISEVSTISFIDYGPKGGRFTKSKLHLRGLWNLKDDGSDHEKQEFAIVGGSGGLANAYGTVTYTKLPADFWHLEGKFQIDDFALVPV